MKSERMVMQMREILFRGKRIDNGEWVYGAYQPPIEWGGRKWDVSIASAAEYGWLEDILVIPETVGQFTGLIDKNGKRIFEGDIVEGHCHSAWSHSLQRCDIAYGRDGFEARNHIDGLGSGYYTYRVQFSKDVVVIGNIHDNPELLEDTNA